MIAIINICTLLYERTQTEKVYKKNGRTAMNERPIKRGSIKGGASHGTFPPIIIKFIRVPHSPITNREEGINVAFFCSSFASLFFLSFFTSHLKINRTLYESIKGAI